MSVIARLISPLEGKVGKSCPPIEIHVLPYRYQYRLTSRVTPLWLYIGYELEYMCS